LLIVADLRVRINPISAELRSYVKRGTNRNTRFSVLSQGALHGYGVGYALV
jgi:hypothetical protein